MQNTTTINQSKTKPNYKTMVEEGLKELDELLLKIDHNQAETAQLRKETQQIAERIREKIKEF